MIRTQVQLTETQAEALRELAAERGVSMSELVRQGVDYVVSTRDKPSKEALWERALAVLGKHRGDGTDVARRHDEYLEQIFAEDLADRHVRPVRAGRRKRS